MTEDEQTIRQLKQQLQMVQRDLVQASQMFNSRANAPEYWRIRDAHLFAKRHIDGMISKNFKE